MFSDQNHELLVIKDEESEFSAQSLSTFTLDGKQWQCPLQYFYYVRAKKFEDDSTAEMIADAKYLDVIRHYGNSYRRISKQYDGVMWENDYGAVLLRAVYAKYCQNPPLRKKLMVTGFSAIVMASRDFQLGIGMKAKNPRIKDITKWRGRNHLGIIHCIIREYIRKERPDLK